MSTPRFTITPQDSDRLTIELAGLDGSPTGILVATVEPDLHQTAAGWTDTDPAWATARLLAAAPELVAALRGARSALCKALPHLPPDAEALFCGEWIDKINETLASVEGGTR